MSVRIYTRKGDDGTTGLYGGGRVPKDSERPVAYGTVDEVQAFLGLARSEVPSGGEEDRLLVAVEKDLYVLMAELATLPENAHKLADGTGRVTAEMVARLEAEIDDLMGRFAMPTEFVIPGQTPLAAKLDVARVVTRRAERAALAVATEGSNVGPYLNRLSDWCWAFARVAEGGSLIAKDP